MSKPELRAIAAAVIGNALEWYDFIVYGFVAVTMSKLFFPPESDLTALLSTLALFGIAFIVRPFGGILLSHYADLIGRKAMLFVIIALMTVGIALIGFAPTYAQVGIAAPLIILVGRLIQGLSAGGEFASATSFLVEHAPPHLRGFYGGWQNSGQGAASLLAGIVGTLLAQLLTPEQLESWGWRVPFLLGLVIGPLGFYIRIRVAETPAFLAARREARADRPRPVRDVFGQHKRRVLTGFGLVLGGTACVYVLIVTIPTYATRTLGLDLSSGFLASLLTGLMLTLLCPVTGYLSDRWGRRIVMGTAVVLLLLLMGPAFVWLNAAPSRSKLLLEALVFGIILSGYSGPFSTAIAELFPVGVRATGLATAYNLGVAVFGGFAPLIVNWLMAKTGDPLVPAYYVMFGLVLTLAALIAMPETRGATAPGLPSAGSVRP